MPTWRIRMLNGDVFERAWNWTTEQEFTDTRESRLKQIEDLAMREKISENFPVYTLDYSLKLDLDRLFCDLVSDVCKLYQAVPSQVVICHENKQVIPHFIYSCYGTDNDGDIKEIHPNEEENEICMIDVINKSDQVNESYAFVRLLLDIPYVPVNELKMYFETHSQDTHDTHDTRIVWFNRGSSTTLQVVDMFFNISEHDSDFLNGHPNRLRELCTPFAWQRFQRFNE